MKKFFAVMICMMLALSLAACSGKDGQQTGGADNAAAPAATEAAEESAPAVAEGPWVLARSSFDYDRYTDFVYDKSGQLIKDIWYNGISEYTYVSNYTYTQQDDGTTLVRRVGETDITSGDEFIYDANGICIEYIMYRTPSMRSDPAEAFAETNMKCRTSYEYDDAGRLVKSTHAYVDNYGTSEIREYAYDEEGRLVSFVINNTDTGEISTAHTLAYGEDGYANHHVIYRANYGESSYDYTHETVASVEHHTPDDYLIGTEKLISNMGGTWQSVEYGYNDDGTIVEITMDNASDIIPPEYMEYFLGEGYRMEENAAYTLTFMPLSLVLEQQNAQ